MCTVRQQSREVCFWTLVSPGHMATTHWAWGRAGHLVSPCCSLSCCGYRKITRPPGPQLSWGESHTVLPPLNWNETSFTKCISSWSSVPLLATSPNVPAACTLTMKGNVVHCSKNVFSACIKRVYSFETGRQIASCFPKPLSPLRGHQPDCVSSLLCI